MDTPSPGQPTRAPASAPTQPLAWQRRLWCAVWPLILVSLSSYFLYRASPTVFLLAGAAALGWLRLRMATVVLLNARPEWVPQVLAAVMLLIYFMQIIYGWREESSYWATLWHVLGWNLVASLFWTFVLA